MTEQFDRIIEAQVSGPITVTSRVHLRGQVIGGLIVASGGSVLIDGQVGGDLLIQRGGRAVLRGMIVGSVLGDGDFVNEGGMVIGQPFD